MIPEKQSSSVNNFHQLHGQSSTFVLPNAWDVVSAKMFEESGFKAIGTTSAGIATSLGYTDGQNIPFKKMIEVVRSIVKSVKVPVSVDIEAGYGETIEEIVKNVQNVIEVGAVGINLEDGTGNPHQPLYDLSFQKEKIIAIKEISNEFPLFVNARTDTYWLNIEDDSTRFQETIKRAKVFEEAGANCIFIPGLNDLEMISNIRKEISAPINLLASPETPSISDLKAVGIERVSCGSAPFRATVTLLKNISQAIINEQSFDYMMNDVMSYKEVINLIK